MMRGGGGNREARRMMDKMGLDMNEVPDVREVVIRTERKEITITGPSVTEMKGKDSSTFVIASDGYEERELEVPSFAEDDVQMVCQMAEVDEEAAKGALAEADGDIARAIMLLKS